MCVSRGRGGAGCSVCVYGIVSGNTTVICNGDKIVRAYPQLLTRRGVKKVGTVLDIQVLAADCCDMRMVHDDNGRRATALLQAAA